MDDFDPSPRAFKRRKTATYGSTRTTASDAASTSPSVLRSITNAVSGISRRLFEPQSAKSTVSAPNVDSAYGAKDGGLEEEESDIEEAHGVAVQPTSLQGRSRNDRLSRGKEILEETLKQGTVPHTIRYLQDEIGFGHDDDLESTDEPAAGRQQSGERGGRRSTRRSGKLGDEANLPQRQLTSAVNSSKQQERQSRNLIVPEVNSTKATKELNLRDIPDAGRRAPNSKNTGKRKSRSSVAQQAPTPNVELESDDVPTDESTAGLVHSPLAASARKANPKEIALDAVMDPELESAKSRVIQRLTSRSLVPLSNLAAEYNKVHGLIEATITAGEGNSMLLLGARGAGKTNLIETAIAELSREHSSDFHVVRLNGFQQTDDKIALREIWHQLGREMQVEEDETNQISSYADTMASLLHLLSHPEELAETFDPNAPATTTKSVIFILDEFDLFTSHPRQTLLYNLFDTAQARKAPVAVIGCSTRVDVVESLEKRVKSRFSHRWIHVSLPKSYQAFEEVVKSALCLEGTSDKWNTYITTTFLPSPPIQSLLHRTFHTTKSIPAALSALHLPIATLTSLSSPPDTTLMSTLTPPDSPIDLVPSLPHLHLCLLISAARLDAIYNATSTNFAFAYAHYVDIASRARLQASAAGAQAQGGVTKIWSREVGVGAWEELARWELLVAGTAGKRGEESAEVRMWRVDVSLEEIGAVLGMEGSGGGGGVGREVLLKWCKEV